MIQIAPKAKHALTRQNLISDDQLEKFGRLIVRSCMWSKEFFDAASSVINFDASTNLYSRNDFLGGETGSIDGLVMAGMLEFRKHYYDGNPYPAAPHEWSRSISQHLIEKFNRNPEWPKEFLQRTLRDLLQGGYPQPAFGEWDLACDGLVDYIYGVRQRAAEQQARNLDPISRKQLLEEVAGSIRVPGHEVVLVTTEDHIQRLLTLAQQTHSFRTGVRLFDQLYGDYAVPGEAWLGFGLPGGGKTILACQALGATAAIGRRALMVSTEVDAGTCILRACSAQQQLSYDALKAVRGIGDLSRSDHGVQLRDWIDTVGRNLTVLDYAKMPGDTFESRMNAILTVFQRQHGRPPEFVVFDWIGKAANVAFKDAWEKREHYNRIAGFMAQLADDLGIVTLTLAQAKPEIKNKTDIAETDTADSQSLSVPMECALALTKLVEPTTGEEAQDVYKTKQWWVIPKHRERPTTKIPVLRRFETQRFADTH